MKNILHFIPTNINLKRTSLRTDQSYSVSSLDAISLDNNLSQNEPVVNTYNTQNSENDANEYKLQEPIDVETENAELKRQLEDVQKRLCFKR